eukprot:scaffold5828_cov168-Amphora_coffeaeformis.AAC.16
MEATPKSPPLQDADLEKLTQQIRGAKKEDIIQALRHQQGTGGNDESLQSCIDQLQGQKKNSLYYLQI